MCFQMRSERRRPDFVTQMESLIRGIITQGHFLKLQRMLNTRENSQPKEGVIGRNLQPKGRGFESGFVVVFRNPHPNLAVSTLSRSRKR